MDLTGDRYWAAAREREQIALVKRRCNREAAEDDGDRFARAMEYIASPGWVPERPPPRLPSKWVIASYWAQRDDWFEIDLDRPHCFACGTAGGYPEDEPERSLRWNGAVNLQRGHIVNRARDGLDGVQNLVPLCVFCNRLMPVFDAGQHEDATAWIFAGGALGELEDRLCQRSADFSERMSVTLMLIEAIAVKCGVAGQSSPAWDVLTRARSRGAA